MAAQEIYEDERKSPTHLHKQHNVCAQSQPRARHTFHTQLKNFASLTK